MEFETKNKAQFLRDISDNGIVQKADNSGGKIEKHDFEKMVIATKCAEDLEKSIGELANQIRNSSESNDKLAGKIYCLNWILVIATVVMAICTVLNLFISPK